MTHKTVDEQIAEIERSLQIIGAGLADLRKVLVKDLTPEQVGRVKELPKVEVISLGPIDEQHDFNIPAITIGGCRCNQCGGKS